MCNTFFLCIYKITETIYIYIYWSQPPPPWNFLGHQRVICSNEATLGGILNSFRMGAGHQKDQALIRSLELAVPFPIIWRQRTEVE